MKKTQKKKGFSLIELIIVIAVIAAIAAVIVPSIGNFSGSAKNASDQRNVQTWNSIYQNLYSLNQSGADWQAAPDFPTAGTSLNTLNAITGTYSLAGKNVTLSAPQVDLTSDGSITFVANSDGATFIQSN